MNWLAEFTTAGIGPTGLDISDALLGLLLAFVLGQMIAWVYMATHAGLSYSRAFVQSIVLLTIIIALGLMFIANNIVIAFGLIGALAVIRFRNILKDTRDTAFVFFALVVGMGAGTGNHLLAVAGTILFCAVVLYLNWSYFGTRHTGDGFIQLYVAEGVSELSALQAVLARYCRFIRLVSQRYQEEGGGEVSYRVTMRDPGRAANLIQELRGIDWVSNVTLVLQEDQAEV